MSQKPRRDSGRNVLADGILAYREGKREQAVDLLERATKLALEAGDMALHDRAFCNRVSIELELGTGHDGISELRRILLRCDDPETACLAAYNIGRVYEVRKENGRALFYAQIAKERSEQTGKTDWLGTSENMIANIHLADSRFEEACSGYESALRWMPEGRTIGRALVLDNLGYTRIMQGRLDEGFGMLFESLRTLNALGARHFQPRPRLSLCYGYLENGKLRSALRHAMIALDIATEFDDHDSIKNSLYLLGEAYNQLGHEDAALERFEQLQRRFYPDAPHVPELLLAVNVRSIINLKA